jgi:MYXO-CTERM domain-containing protein
MQIHQHHVRAQVIRVLAAAFTVTLASGGSTMAGIVHFINPDPGQEGHFNWNLQDPDGPITFEQWLDITKPSTDQFELRNGNSVGQLFDDNGGDWVNSTSNGAEVARVLDRFDTRAFDLNEVIDETALYNHLAFHVYSDGFGIQSDFPQGELRYIGVRTEAGNYGWIAVIRDIRSLRALAWAYETEPGVPINAGQVPAVGGVALFGLAGLAARRRRREGSTSDAR